MDHRANPSRITALLLSCLFPILSYAATTPHWVHYTLLQGEPKLPKKVVVLPVNIEVVEVTAGGVEEEVPDWSAEASNSVLKALSAKIKNEPSLKEVKLPRLSKKNNRNVDEHIALYKLVVNTAASLNWEHKARRFDYSIGPGLKLLRKKTGADAAILVYGQDEVSTTGRKAKAVISRIPFVGALAGPPPTLGHSYIHVGVVDLKTGNLLWMNSEYQDGATDLRNHDDAKELVNTIFEWYPAIEKYRAAYVK